MNAFADFRPDFSFLHDAESYSAAATLLLLLLLLLLWLSSSSSLLFCLAKQ